MFVLHKSCDVHFLPPALKVNFLLETIFKLILRYIGLTKQGENI